MMARQRTTKFIPLFSHQAAAILSQPLQLAGSERYHLKLNPEPEPYPTVVASSSAASKPHCVSCQTSFPSREEQVAHYRLDWHRYNLKRRLKRQPSVSQEEFERIAGDLSSISGSESNSDEDSGVEEDTLQKVERHAQLSGSPFIHFTTEDESGYAIYKSVITTSKTSMAEEELLGQLKSLRQQPQVWVVLMKAGGHFAGAIFRDSNILAHKTFHRYTVRAKRGTAQSLRDSQQGGSHQPRSAGASLRRYNEAALEQEIHDLIASWSQYVEEASAIFIRTPKYSKSVFIGGKNSPFSRDDSRLRNIPFVTRRPTLKEIQLVHSKLAALYTGFPAVHNKPHVLRPTLETAKDMESIPLTLLSNEPLPADNEGMGDVIAEEVVSEGGRRKAGKRKKERKEKTSEMDAIPSEIQELIKVCREGNVDTLTELLAGIGLEPIHTIPETEHSSCPSPPPGGAPDVLNSLYGGQTVLHVASGCGQEDSVRLLLQYGANPATRDSRGHTPYSLAQDKSVRDSFRRFMALFPSAYDFAAAQVPSPLTEDMERERREKMAEKKKAQKKAKRQREKERKSEQEVAASQLAQEQAMATLSERERRALAAEKRMVQQLPSATNVQRAGQCSCCDVNLAGIVPFERLQFKYCSMACLKEHRTMLAKN